MGQSLDIVEDCAETLAAVFRAAEISSFSPFIPLDLNGWCDTLCE